MDQKMSEPLKEMEDHLSSLANQLMSLPKWIDDNDSATVHETSTSENTIRVSDDKYPTTFELMKEFDNTFYGLVEAKEKQQQEEQEKKDAEASNKDLESQIRKISDDLTQLLDRMRLTARAYWRLRRRIKLKNAKYVTNETSANQNWIPFFVKEDPELEEINNVTDPLFFHRTMQDQVAFARKYYSRMEELVALRYKDCDLEDVTAEEDGSENEQMNHDLDMISDMNQRIEGMCSACLLTVHQIEIDGEGPRDCMTELMAAANDPDQQQQEESDASSTNLSDNLADLNSDSSEGMYQRTDVQGHEDPANTSAMTIKRLTPEELHKQEEERLEQEIQEMTAQLKASTIAMHSTLQDQTKGLDAIHDAVTQNLDSVSNVTDTVTERNQRGWRKQAATWTLFFSCLTTFIVLFFTMRIIPKRQNACIFFGCSSTRTRDNNNHYHRYHDIPTEQTESRRERVQPKCSDEDGRPRQCGSHVMDEQDEYLFDSDNGEDAAAAKRWAEERRLKRLTDRLAKASTDRFADGNTFRRAAEKTAQRSKSENMLSIDSEVAEGDYYSTDEEGASEEGTGTWEEEDGDDDEAETWHGEDEDTETWHGEDEDKETWLTAQEKADERLKDEQTSEYESEDDVFDNNMQQEFAFDARRGETQKEDDLWDYGTKSEYATRPQEPVRKKMTPEEVRELESELRVAARNGNLPLIKSLLKQRPSAVHAVDQNGWSALHEASRAGQTAAVEFLVLQHGANVNFRSNFGYGGTPLFLSVSSHGETHPTSRFLKMRGAEMIHPKY